MRAWVGRRVRRRDGGRVTTRVAVIMAMLLVVTLAAPPSNVTRYGPVSLSWSHVLSWLAAPAGWALPPLPPTPKQAGGTAAGRAHLVSAEATRAGGGNGHAPGTGVGELPPYAPHSRSTQPSTTGHALGDPASSFDPARSKRLAGSATATSDLYQNDDGSYTRVLSAAPRNYRGPDGSWQSIDTSLSKGADGRVHVTANQFAADFSASADDPVLVSVRPDGGHRFGYGLQGADAVVAEVSGSRVMYPNVLDSTDLVLDSLSSEIKESLVLHSADAPASFVFPLTLSGLTARLTARGEVEFVDSKGSVVGTMPRSYMRDSKVNPVSGRAVTSEAITYALETVNGKPALRMTVDASWLRDPARVFPVTIDPTYTATTNGTTYVLSDSSSDYSAWNDLDVGTWNGGSEIGNSFIAFSGLESALSKLHITSATLNLWDYWASTCVPSRFDVAAITQSWNASTLNTYPGPSRGASIGNLTTAPGSACYNVAGDNNHGQSMSVALDTATFNSWTTGGANNGLTVYASTTDSASWKRFDSIHTSHPPYLVLNYTSNVAPQIDSMYPPTNYNAPTLTPELIALGHDPDNWPSALKYDFKIYDTAGTVQKDSGWIGANSWLVPAGTLVWSKTYFWSVQTYDGVDYSQQTAATYLNTTVPQPLITSNLSQSTGEHGFDPAAGNYTTSVSDAQVQTVGPSLSVQRDYNSLDPRSSQAFGAGWSSLYDMRAVEVSTAGALTGVIITYPNGQEVEFGRDPDGTFAPPQGRYATLTSLNPGYKLVDKSGTTYTFTVATGATGTYGITSITDVLNRAETFAYTGAFVNTVTSAVSSRALHFTWSQPPGATAQHVQTVATDPATPGDASTALTWTYSYTGDQLTNVCPPGTTTACTTYQYTGGSHFHTTVIDAGPRDYWRLSDPSGTTTAADQMLINENTLNGTYTASTMTGAAAGPLNNGLKAATFNGSNTAVTLPNNLITASTYLSVGLWFKTTSTATGTLFSTGHSAPGTANPSGGAMPVLYVGSDGKLYGHFWNGNATGITSPVSVNDGKWHYVVLTAAGNTQSLYLDGAQVGSQTGQVTDVDPIDMVGAGVYNSNGWPAAPSGNTWNYFNGQIAEAAYYTYPLSAPVVSAQWSAAGKPANLLTTVTRPSGNRDTTVAYNTADDNLTSLTDTNGATWTLGAPAITGSSKVYAGAVLGSAPRDYWRLGESGTPSEAVNQVRGGTATYNAVTLNVTGAFGSGDDAAASFNGTSSYLKLPNDLFPAGASTQEMWFNTTGKDQVLLSSQTAALGSTTCPCLPVMWITSDGKLRALSPSTSPNGPFTAKSLTGKCIDLDHGNTANGTKVQVWTCNNSNPQNWTLYPDGTIRNYGKCLDIYNYGTTNGSKIQLYDCHATANQIWQPYNNGLRNPASGRCLDDPNSSTTDGTQFQLYDCNGTNAQQWVQSLVTSSAVNDGTWHHAVLTTDGKAQWLYVDGALASSTTGSFTLTPGSLSYAYLGAGYNGTTAAGLPADSTRYYTGTLDEAAFYTSTMSSADVTRHWAAYKSAYGIAPVETVNVTGPGGITSTYTYDAENGNRPLSTTDGLGSTTQYGYDTSGFLHTVTDPDGDVTTTGHDIRGNTVSQTTCQNQVTQVCSTTYYTYFPDDTTAHPVADQRNDLVLTARDGRSASATDPAYVTTYTYDATGNRTKVTLPPVAGYPSGRTSTTVYTDGSTQAAADNGYAPAGLVASASTPGGATETVTYFHNGDPATVTDAAGVVTRYTYDGLGRVLTKTVVSDSYPNGLTTSYTYDGENRPVTITDPAVTNRVTGAVHTARTTNVYDVDGNTLSTTVDDLTGGDAPRTARNAFDASGRVVTATDAAGRTTTYGYDGYGNRISETDAAGNVTAYTYDADKHLLTTTLKGYTGDPANPSTARDLVESSRAYDPAGRLASIADSMGWETDYTYTDNGLAGTVTRKDPTSGATFVQQSNTYDGAGNLTRRVTNNGTTTTTYTVDASNRTTSATLDPTGLNRTTSYSYSPDDVVLTTRISDASGTASAVDATYDSLGRKTSETVHNDSTGHPVGWWKLSDGPGLLAADSSGQGQTAFASGSASLSSGVATFNGSAGSIATGGPAVDTSNSFSVSAWVRLDAITSGKNQTFVSQDGSTVSSFLLKYDGTNNRWDFSMENSDTTSPPGQHAESSAAPTLGAWTHLVGVFDASTKGMTLYVDGAAQGTATESTPWNATGPLAIGRCKWNGGTGCDYPTGSISEVQVYDRALSASDVATLHSDGGTNATWAGGALRYTQASGPVSVSAGTVPTGVGASFSVSAWVKPTSLPTDTAPNVVSESGVNSTSFRLVYVPSDKTWQFIRSDTDSLAPTYYRAIASTTPVQVGTWTHLVGLFDAGTSKLSIYVNGALAGTSDAVPASAQWSAPGPLVIGSCNYNGSLTGTFPGQIANVQSFSRALSTGDITALYYATADGPSLNTKVITTRWALDQRGAPTSMTDPAGNVTAYENDEAGRKAVQAAPAVTVETNGQPAVIEHPTSMIGYDTFGERVETSDPNGNVTTTGYDAGGRVLSTTLPDYTPPGSSTAISAVATRTYDSLGQVATATDPLNHTTTYAYDQLGDVATATDPAGGVTHYTYDTNGDRLSATDPTGAQTQATYDYLGRQLTSTEVVRQTGQAYTTTNSYNLAGGYLSKTTSPNGVATSYAYDAAGETTQVTDGASNTTTLRYDALGRTVATLLPDRTSHTTAFDEAGNAVAAADLDASGATLRGTSATYDATGHPLTSTDALGHTTTFAYDASGVLTQEVQPVSATSSITTSFGYDAVGNRTRFTDGRGNAFWTTYNTWNKPESSIEPTTSVYPDAADRTFTVAYDAAGRVASQTSPGGVVVTDSYDDLGNLTSQTGTGADASTDAHSYGYDAAGRLTSVSAPGGTDTFSYDDRGLLLSASGPSGASSFAYNSDGQVGTRTDAAGTSTYTYDPAGRLHTIADASTGANLSFGYDVDSELTSINYGAGKANRTYTYNSLHQLTGDTLTDPTGATEASIGYGYDLTGNETSKTTTGFVGAAGNTYTYDWAGRLTSWNNGTTTVGYGYDASGNRTQVGSRFFTYDARNEVTSDGVKSYSYTPRGTISSVTDGVTTTTSTSDAFNRVITDGSQAYTYDGLDRLVNRGTFTFSYSGLGNTVASDGGSTYSRGPIGELIGIASGGTTGLAFTDQHTDVVGTFTPDNTSLTGSVTYDPLGNVTAIANKLGNLGYQSGWTDPVTSKVNMAARWYDPDSAQFTSRDTVANPAAPNSVAANRFQYGNGSPLIGTDPTGHCDWWNVLCGAQQKAQQVVNNVKQAVTSTWNTVTSFASSAGDWLADNARQFYHNARQFVSHAAAVVKHAVTTVVHKVNDAANNAKKWVNNTVTNTVNKIKQTAKTVWKAAVYTYQHPVEALKNTAQATGQFLKAHAADITSFIASTAVFMGCEAVLGVATAGVGAVAGAVACGALSGAVGSAITYGMTTPRDKWNFGDAAKAIGMGAATGAIGSFLGEAGGKLVATFGSKLLGPVMDSVASRLGPAALEDGVTTVAEDVTETATKDFAEAGVEDVTGGATKEAGTVADEASAAEPHGSGEGEGESSSGGSKCHSFDPSTPVLLADGTTKPIGDVKLGDKVASTDPKTGDNKAEPVVALHDNHDSDLADVTVQSSDGKTTTLHTTWHHPFWNDSTKQWTDAADLKPGVALHVWDGTSYAVTVVSIKTWTGLHDMHDITVAELHTYYVVAGSTPVLVHNNDVCPLDEARQARDDLAKEVGASKSTVTAGRDPATGKVAAGCANALGCAEDEVARQLDIDPKEVQFTEAIRPRNGEQVAICHNCQMKYNMSQFPSGTKVKPGGAWGVEVVP